MYMNNSKNKERLLSNFVFNNLDLDLLESEINKFNPYRILQVENIEIRHSNTLAWLLNPHENHGLGNLFLKKFISDVLIFNEEKESDFDNIKMLEEELFEFQSVLIRIQTERAVVKARVDAMPARGEIDLYHLRVHDICFSSTSETKY